MRQIVLDTETTGLEPSQDHRIIEIGCVELVDRRTTGSTYQIYLNPEREVDEGAEQVHGISNQFLLDKPRFVEVVQEFIDYIQGAELIIHNAPFDVGFLDHELRRMGGALGKLEDHCTVLDTLHLARRMHPGQKNNLDALCKRYDIDNSQRDLHGALLDARILADVYLAMTGGQASLLLDDQEGGGRLEGQRIRRLPGDRPRLRVVVATEQELAAHQAQLALLDQASGGACAWRSLEAARPDGSED